MGLEVLLIVEHLVDAGLGASGGGLETADLIARKREIDTPVPAYDGRTILGGLIQDDIRESRRTVPLLGDGPAVGRPFRGYREARAKLNLLAFLRPTVFRTEEDISVTTGRLYDHVREFRLESRPSGATPTPDDLYDGRRAAVPDRTPVPLVRASAWTTTPNEGTGSEPFGAVLRSTGRTDRRCST